MRPLTRKFRRTRVAWSRDLGGLPMDSRVSDVLEAQRSVFNRLGCIVEEAEPDLAPATEAFHTLRALAFVQRYGPLLKESARSSRAPSSWNAEQGLKLGAQEIARAQALAYRAFSTACARSSSAMNSCSVRQPGAAFPVEIEYPTEIAGTKMDNYIDWMKKLLLDHDDGASGGLGAGRLHARALPVGLQIVGRHRDDFGVLQLAHASSRKRSAGGGARRPAVE